MARLNRFLAWLCLASAMFALPLSAEEITVTIPPDQVLAPSPAASAPQTPPTTSALPTFTGASKLSAPKSADASGVGEQQPAPPSKAEVPPPTAPQPPTPAPQAGTEQTVPPASSAEAPKPKAKVKKAAKPAAKPAAAEATAETPAATTKPAAKAAKHAKTASSSCKGLDQNACGGNTQCIWVVGTPDAAGKGPAARCRSLAVLKKEAKKADNPGKPDVLPWLQKTTATPAGAPAAGAPLKAKTVSKTETKTAAKTEGKTETKAEPKKVKKAKTATTALAKPPAKPKEIAPPIPTGDDAGQDGPQSAPPAPTDSQ